MSDTIEKSVLRKLMNKHDLNSNLFYESFFKDLREIVKEKPEFKVGEIAVFFDEETTRIGLFEGVTGQGVYLADGNQVFGNCRKLNSMPINLISYSNFERGDKPPCTGSVLVQNSEGTLDVGDVSDFNWKWSINPKCIVKYMPLNIL